MNPVRKRSSLIPQSGNGSASATLSSLKNDLCRRQESVVFSNGVNWNHIAEKVCRGDKITKKEAHTILDCPNESLLSLLDAAFLVRRKFFGKRIKLNFLLNVKSGLCPEDCSYCSQSKISKAKIDKYPFLPEKEIISAAKRAVTVKAKRICMVNSGRAPAENEVKRISAAVEKIKKKFPQLEVCVCLGLLENHQAEKLKKSGVDAYNHNLNTSKNYYSQSCTTHSYKDRVRTVKIIKEFGLSPCSGCLLGMGEKDQDIVELAFDLKKIGVDSIPLNFLLPIPGTPFENKNELTPQKCLKIICLFRFVNPKTEIRIAAGREVHLRWLQPLGLYAANSIFIGDYLTTKGQKPEADLAMIEDLGFEIEGDPYHRGKRSSKPVAILEDFAVRLR